MRARNIARLPVAIFVRAPVVLLALALGWLAGRLEALAGMIPGLERPL